jgi:dynein heavy chain 2
MYKEAGVLENLIQNPQGRKKTEKHITWEQPNEIEYFTKQVKHYATILIEENRRLRKIHLNVMDMVIELMNMDLLKRREDWFKKCQHIR